MRISLLLGATAALLLAPFANADKIYTSDGKSIEGVSIVEEGVSEITYRDGRNERKVNTADVVEIVYEDLPRYIENGITQVEDGDLEGAIQTYSDYVDRIIAGELRETRRRWAPANAAWRIVALQDSLGDLEASAAAAARVIASFPDSRYLPMAYMAKADAEYWNGAPEAAQKTLADFKATIASKKLADRWSIEADLALIQTDDALVGEPRRKALEKIAQRAKGKYVTVKNRALVGIGESALADVAAKRGNAKDLIAVALDNFNEVIGDPLAENVTLAGAYAGRGDCLFAMGSGSKDKAQLKQALLSFLRVAAVYPDQTRYVPKSLFYAGRCFDLMETETGPERAQQMYAEVYWRFPGSKWANEAKNFSSRR